jgi:hypothetical protein
MTSSDNLIGYAAKLTESVAAGGTGTGPADPGQGILGAADGSVHDAMVVCVCLTGPMKTALAVHGNGHRARPAPAELYEQRVLMQALKQA